MTVSYEPRTAFSLRALSLMVMLDKGKVHQGHKVLHIALLYHTSLRHQSIQS